MHIAVWLLPGRVTLDSLLSFSAPSGSPNVRDVIPLKPWSGVTGEGNCKASAHHGHPTNNDPFQLTISSRLAGRRTGTPPPRLTPRLTCEQTHSPALSPCPSCSEGRRSRVEHWARSRDIGFWSHVCCWLCDLGQVSCPLWTCGPPLPLPTCTPSPCCLAFVPLDPFLASWGSYTRPGQEMTMGLAAPGEQSTCHPHPVPPPQAPTLPSLRKHGWKDWDAGGTGVLCS